MKRLLGMGNALVDALLRLENDDLLARLGLAKGAMQLIDTARFHEIRSRLEGLHMARATGGSAANTVQALARLGARPGLVGMTGRDDDGRFFARQCRRLGIAPYLLESDLPTGVASTFISPDGQRTFATYLGAAAQLRAEDVRPDWFRDFDYFYIEGYLVQNHGLIDRAIDTARAAGCQVCLDLSSYNVVAADRDFFASLLPRTDIVFANEDEAYAFTGKTAGRALDALARICPTVVVKTGPGGAMARCGSEMAESPAPDVERVVDTTGAGDFFAAGFLYMHALGADLVECIDAGNLLGSHVIQTVGASLTDEAWASIRETLPRP